MRQAKRGSPGGRPDSFDYNNLRIGSFNAENSIQKPYPQNGCSEINFFSKLMHFIENIATKVLSREREVQVDLEIRPDGIRFGLAYRSR